MNATTGNLPSPQFHEVCTSSRCQHQRLHPINSTFSFSPASRKTAASPPASLPIFRRRSARRSQLYRSSMQVVSYDPATGSSPATHGSGHPQQESHRANHGAAPYYSLAVLGPFTKTPSACPTSRRPAACPAHRAGQLGGADASLQVGSPAASATPGTTTLKAGAQLAQSAPQWFGGTDPSLQNSSAWLRVKSDQSAVRRPAFLRHGPGFCRSPVRSCGHAGVFPTCSPTTCLKPPHLVNRTAAMTT